MLYTYDNVYTMTRYGIVNGIDDNCFESNGLYVGAGDNYSFNAASYVQNKVRYLSLIKGADLSASILYNVSWEKIIFFFFLS